mmetsp:Transcript_38026/g.34043  ORF Transcript_38026/g.34043 Transcript_38026/m.34043 type:complete len:130 (-) Transcript_38026:618-1007(-)
MASKGCMGCFICVYAVGILVGIILMSLSFKIVELNRAALRQNTFSRNIESDKIYMPGRYYVGLTGKFIEYSTLWVGMDFNSGSSDSGLISAQTASKSTVSLDVSLMYRIKVEYLHNLYDAYPSQNQRAL